MISAAIVFTKHAHDNLSRTGKGLRNAIIILSYISYIIRKYHGKPCTGFII